MKITIKNSNLFQSTNVAGMAPYTAALNAVNGAQIVDRGAVAPCNIGMLIIEEAFAMLHSTALYSGMGEEAISAFFFCRTCFCGGDLAKALDLEFCRQ